MNVPLEVWSGGQTGVDRAGLDAAMEIGIKHGGWIPMGRRSEDGIIPATYNGLVECDTVDYPVRTRLNVRDTDGTLLFVNPDRPSRGTDLTRRLAQRLEKPLLIVSITNPPEPQKFLEWVKNYGIKKLNVAGPRESSNPGIHDKAQQILIQYFRTIQ